MNIGGMSGGQPDFSAMRARIDAKMSEMFAAGDTDGNGGLSKEEFSSAHDARKAEGGPRGPSGPGRANKLSAEELFSKMDQDDDGQVTEAEMQALRPPPPPPHGSFSADMMSSLLSVQEGAQEDGINQILSTAIESDDEDDDSEDDLISQLLESAA